jgi:putative SOS response-associated peptidase YedK
MCGRFTLRAIDRIKLRLSHAQQLSLDAFSPRYNIAPSQDVLAVITQAGTATPAWMRWGLIPSWSNEPKGFINARAETVERKPSFSESFERRRCLIPADGFFEWPRHKLTRQPYYFQLRDEAPFAFAGLWDRWQQNGVSINSCAIVTTAANELLAPIHDRMPVILTPEAQEEWLRGHDDPTELKELLSPYPAAEMKSHPVSRRVNYPDNDDQELVEPVALIEEPQTGTLFEL